MLKMTGYPEVVAKRASWISRIPERHFRALVVNLQSSAKCDESSSTSIILLPWRLNKIMTVFSTIVSSEYDKHDQNAFLGKKLLSTPVHARLQEMLFLQWDYKVGVHRLMMWLPFGLWGMQVVGGASMKAHGTRTRSYPACHSLFLERCNSWT